MSKVLIALDKSESFRVYSTITTDLVEKARKIHDTSPLATAALGRTLTGTGIIGLMGKGEKDKVTVLIKGDGPARQILATAAGNGEVKGYISNPDVDLPLKKDGHMDVSGAIGKGDLTVIRDMGLKDPYVGKIGLASGEIAEDFTAYFYISEQQNTSVALGVKIGKDLSVIASGGMIIQMLPGFDEKSVDVLEKMISEMPPITTLISETYLKTKGMSEQGLNEELLNTIFAEVPEEYKPEVIDTKELNWKCSCSKENYSRGLMTLDPGELKEMIEEDGGAEVICQFCRKKYYFTKEELNEILNEVQNGKEERHT